MSTFSRVVFILQDPRPRLGTQGPLDVVSGGRCARGQAAGGHTQPVLVRLLGDPRTGGRSRNASGAWDSGLRPSAKPCPCLLLTPAHPSAMGECEATTMCPQVGGLTLRHAQAGVPGHPAGVQLGGRALLPHLGPPSWPSLGGPDSVRMRSCGLVAARPLPAWTAPHPRICDGGLGP